MKAIILNTLLIACSFYNVVLAQDISLKILDREIEISQDSNLLNNFDPDLILDTIYSAKYDCFEIELTNRTQKTIIFTNFPTILYSNQFTGNCNLYYSTYDSIYLSHNSNVCFSIYDDNINLTFSQISGVDPCLFSDLPDDLDINTFTKLSDSLICNGGSFAADVSNIKSFRKDGIRTIIKLDPNTSIKWKIFFKNCELRSFNDIISNKEYIFRLYYQQGNNIILPSTFLLENYELFEGLLISNDVPIIYLD